jgi:hypothetical protein
VSVETRDRIPEYVITGEPHMLKVALNGGRKLGSHQALPTAPVEFGRGGSADCIGAGQGLFTCIRVRLRGANPSTGR